MNLTRKVKKKTIIFDFLILLIFKSVKLPRSMSLKVKIKIMSMVSATMAIGFIMMKNVPVGRLILFIVWLFHIGYFVFAVKTESKKPVKLVTKEANEVS